MDSFLSLPLDSGTAVAFVKLRLEQSGYRVSFALDIASSCASFSDHTCPHKNAEACECQLTILQISDGGSNRVALALHSLDEETDLSIPHQSTQTPKDFVSAIQASLTLQDNIGDLDYSRSYLKNAF